MRVVIIGQKWLGERLLSQCLTDKISVLAVVAPGSGDRLYQAAKKHGITAFDAMPPGDRLPASDVILSAHAHQFIGEVHRKTAKLGAVGYHPSLLPRHRGRDAVRWAIHMREPVTGGTLYRLGDGADTGGILLQDWCHIRPDDTPRTLWERELAPMGLRLFRQYLINPWNIPAVPQDETLATFEPAFTVGRLSDVNI